jgi:hypothetical protein
MKLAEQISLPNGLIVEAWDTSIPIAADTTRVKLFIRINVQLQPSYFIKSEHFDLVRGILGPEIFFEYIKERSFVKNKEKDTVFQDLLKSFKKASLPYLSKTTFPRYFALSKYWDIEKNRYKYHSYYVDKPS